MATYKSTESGVANAASGLIGSQESLIQANNRQTAVNIGIAEGASNTIGQVNKDIQSTLQYVGNKKLKDVFYKIDRGLKQFQFDSQKISDPTIYRAALEKNLNKWQKAIDDNTAYLFPEQQATLNRKIESIKDDGDNFHSNLISQQNSLQGKEMVDDMSYRARGWVRNPRASDEANEAALEKMLLNNQPDINSNINVTYGDGVSDEAKTIYRAQMNAKVIEGIVNNKDPRVAQMLQDIIRKKGKNAEQFIRDIGFHDAASFRNTIDQYSDKKTSENFLNRNQRYIIGEKGVTPYSYQEVYDARSKGYITQPTETMLLQKRMMLDRLMKDRTVDEVTTGDAFALKTPQQIDESFAKVGPYMMQNGGFKSIAEARDAYYKRVENHSKQFNEDPITYLRQYYPTDSQEDLATMAREKNPDLAGALTNPQQSHFNSQIVPEQGIENVSQAKKIMKGSTEAAAQFTAMQNATGAGLSLPIDQNGKTAQWYQDAIKKSDPILSAASPWLMEPRNPNDEMVGDKILGARLMKKQNLSEYNKIQKAMYNGDNNRNTAMDKFYDTIGSALAKGNRSASDKIFEEQVEPYMIANNKNDVAGAVTDMYNKRDIRSLGSQLLYDGGKLGDTFEQYADVVHDVKNVRGNGNFFKAIFRNEDQLKNSVLNQKTGLGLFIKDDLRQQLNTPEGIKHVEAIIRGSEMRIRNGKFEIYTRYSSYQPEIVASIDLVPGDGGKLYLPSYVTDVYQTQEAKNEKYAREKVADDLTFRDQFDITG